MAAGFRRGGTGALFTFACTEITHPAQGTASGSQARPPLREALLRDGADQALAQPRERGAIDVRELLEVAGDGAFAGDPSAPRDSHAGGCQAVRARTSGAAR